MKTKARRIFKIIAIVILAIALFCGIAAVIGLNRAKANRVGHYVYTDEERTISGPETEGIGSVTVSTLPLEGDFGVRRATYSYSKATTRRILIRIPPAAPPCGRIMRQI